MDKLTFVIDIDNTLIISKKNKCDSCGRMKYYLETVDEKEIERVNKFYFQGHTIIMYTGRGWDIYSETIAMLNKIGVHYHELVMGKPQGIYIDKDARKSLEEFA
jgi:hypothetical protein